ncbi:hypothetical protein J2X36_003125 [Methylobacterium sp. BE186]|nr:hypothetical protein [Methylobacterium sp. BE186]MDR7038361.1 hypothetical protein [Methylobacterium sp. BE186]
MAERCCDAPRRRDPERRGLAGRLNDLALVAGALGLALILILVGA